MTPCLLSEVRMAPDCAADNNRKKDARLLYMMELASSQLPLYHGCYAILISGKRDDFFAGHVSCNCAYKPQRKNNK